MNTLTSRLLNAGLVVCAVVLAPHVAFAQDVAPVMDNSSGFIGGLVIWLLPIGGLLAVGTMVQMDKTAQASRSTRR